MPPKRSKPHVERREWTHDKHPMGKLTAFCLHCNARHTIDNPTIKHTGNHYFVRGKCSKCHHDVSRPTSQAEMHGSGAVADILGSIPMLGSFLGPIASSLGG